MGLETSTWHKSGSSMGLFTQSHWCGGTRLAGICRMATIATGRLLVTTRCHLHQGAAFYPAPGDECGNSGMGRKGYCS